MSALVVHSGGLDSTVALCWAKKQYGKVESISFCYGQRHDTELFVAEDICNYLSVPHTEQEVHIPAGGVLMTNGQMPHLTYDELSKIEGPSPTFVPNRNMIFLSLATAHALTHDHDVIVAGMHGEDARNWAYPDCTPEFIGAMQNAIYVASYSKVRLVCPWTYYSKADVIQEGIKLGAPLHLTLSCYEGSRPACGRCPTCVARLEAFKSLKLSDPIDYEFDTYRKGATPAQVVKASLQLLHEMEDDGA